MRFKEIISKVQSSKEFKKWYAEHDSAFLAHLFFTDDGTGQITYDVGYYLPLTEKMASFEVEPDKEASLKDISDVFKKPGAEIKPIDIENIKISSKDALDKAQELQQKKYPNSKPFKRIVILQNLDVGQVWNITYVTQTFETLNIKINAHTGKVTEDKIHKIFEFDKQ